MIAGDYFYYLPKRKYWGGLGFEISSGDDGTDPGVISYFDDNYSSKHKTFGFMDYFKSPTGIKSKGLQDFIVHIGGYPIEKLKYQVDLHHFSLEKEYVSVKDGKSAHNLGFEIDSQLKCIIRKGLTGEIGIDMFIPDPDWKDKPGDISTLIYLVLTASI